MEQSEYLNTWEILLLKFARTLREHLEGEAERREREEYEGQLIEKAKKAQGLLK